VQAWFPGQEWGRALADVLSGDVSPSGRLPMTIPVRIEDAPPMAGGPSSYPGADGQVHYTEGLLVGHRWHDTKGVEPRYPFGHGLTYTTFEYADMRVAGERIDVEVANVGDVAACEVVQAYLHRRDRDGAGARPVQVLAGFAKVRLDPGERKVVALALSERAFQRWDLDVHDWVTVPGEYEVRLGSSSRDIRVTHPLRVH
jgi:beta-glucosidase